MISAKIASNSNEALTPLDGLWKCWPRASPASFAALLNPLLPSHRLTPHSPLTAGKFCLNFFCSLWCYVPAKINLCICLANASSKRIIIENRDKSMGQHLRMKFSHIHHKVKNHWTRVGLVSNILRVFCLIYSFLRAQTFYFGHTVPTWKCTQMLLPKSTAFLFLEQHLIKSSWFCCVSVPLPPANDWADAVSPLLKNCTNRETTAPHNIWQIKEKKMQPVLSLF